MSVADNEASYEELAEEAPEAPEDAPEEAPAKRKPGRPQGSKNKPKNPPQSAEPESVTPAAPKESQESQLLPVLDVDFDEGPGGGRQPSGRAASAKTRPKPIKPVRLARSQSAGGADYALLQYVAEAARAYGAQERLKRQDFYDRFLPIL